MQTDSAAVSGLIADSEPANLSLFTATRFLAQCRQHSQLNVQTLAWCDLVDWHFVDGILCHRSGGFFKIAALHTRTSATSTTHQQIFILQPEVGILGFIFTRINGQAQILLQAKTEPGNVMGTQFAPSVQATISNYTKKHGGADTVFLSYVSSAIADSNQRKALPAGVQLLAQTNQSEQGTRFFDKFNCNISVLCDEFPHELPAAWCWTNMPALRQLVLQDYCINTDARSVLACTDWRVLSDDTPFAMRHDNHHDARFRALLCESYARISFSTVQMALARLISLQSCSIQQCKVAPLATAPRWQHQSRCGLTDSQGEFNLALVNVKTKDREVASWQQPLLQTLDVGHVVLLCHEFKDGLKFLIRARAEPGFSRSLEFGPTFNSECDLDLAERERWFPWIYQRIGLVQSHASVMQSDEGGRFMESAARYEIVESIATPPKINDPHFIWLSLGEIKTMLLQTGVFNNELRSALALLIHWL
jgi:dTDP-4-dehydro-6-deoxy-alpha-D-glucopyranose 2,3-dehydratase